jgi:hypothetical protein
VAWLGQESLGQCFDTGRNAEGSRSGLDRLKAVRLFIKQDEDGYNLRKTTMTALVRDTDNKILSFVPDDWNPLQNKDAAKFFCEFVCWWRNDDGNGGFAERRSSARGSSPRPVTNSGSASRARMT